MSNSKIVVIKIQESNTKPVSAEATTTPVSRAFGASVRHWGSYTSRLPWRVGTMMPTTPAPILRAISWIQIIRVKVISQKPITVDKLAWLLGRRRGQKRWYTKYDYGWYSKDLKLNVLQLIWMNWSIYIATLHEFVELYRSSFSFIQSLHEESA